MIQSGDGDWIINFLFLEADRDCLIFMPPVQDLVLRAEAFLFGGISPPN